MGCSSGKVTRRLWASKPYPVLVEKEDAYQPTVKPLNITLKRILKDTTIDSDAYQPSVKPLDITLRSLLMRKDVDDNDTYMPSVKPLEMGIYTQPPPKKYEAVVNDDAINTAATAFDLTIRRLLLDHKNLSGDAFSPTAKALNITKTTEV